MSKVSEINDQIILLLETTGESVPNLDRTLIAEMKKIITILHDAENHIHLHNAYPFSCKLIDVINLSFHRLLFELQCNIGDFFAGESNIPSDIMDQLSALNRLHLELLKLTEGVFDKEMKALRVGYLAKNRLSGKEEWS